MLKREDRYCLEGTCNTFNGEHDVKLDQEYTLAGLTDAIGGLIEAVPEASSFVFTVVRVTHTSEEVIN